MSERLSRSAWEDRPEVGGNIAIEEKKTSVYFKGNVLQQIRECAAKSDRSVSWILTRAWQIAREELEALPSMPDARVRDPE